MNNNFPVEFYLWNNLITGLIQLNLKHTIMKAKQSTGADLQNKKTLFFEIGMITALAIVFAAFQWSTDVDNRIILTNGSAELIVEDLIPITRPEPPKLPELPKPRAVDVVIVPDGEIDIPDVEIPDMEGNLNMPIKIVDIGFEQVDETEQETFYRVEEMPVYPGGDKALMKDIMSRVIYPELAKGNGAMGRVFVQFVVNSKGEVDKVKVTRSVDPLLDNEAIRVIKTLKGWTPGKQRGKPVNVSFTVPINFQLN